MGNNKLVMYTQCRLTLKTGGNGDAELVDEVWIPSQFAVVGKTLKLKKPDGTWENGWVVKERGFTRSAEWLQEHERDHLHQREASDV